jgi:hypothetical protein
MILPKHNRPLHFVMLMMLVMPLYAYGVRAQWHINSNLQRVDQNAYIEYTKGLAEDIHYLGDRNRMPLYPFLQSLHYQSGEQDRILFEKGKLLNVVLATVLVVMVAGWFWRYLSPSNAIFAILLNTLFVFAYIAPYFQTEVLFLGLFFACFLLMIRLLTQPNVGLGLFTGGLLGLAHLTKASVSLLLGAFILTMLCQIVVERHQIPQRLGVVMAVVLMFLGVIYPYIRQSKTHYGSYFYNVNTTFYLWYDSWEEVEQGTKAAGDREHYPDLPADQIPSFRHYIQEHSPIEMIERLLGGIGKTFYLHVFRSYGYAQYILLYVVGLAWVAVRHRRQTQQFILAHRWLALFVAVTFGVYVAAFGWYLPISTGRRFLLTLWLPALWIMCWLGEQYAPFRKWQFILVGLLIVDILFLWHVKIATFMA